MRKIAVALIAVALVACTAAKINQILKSPAGQVFCAIQTGGGGAIVVGLINAELSALAPVGAPVAVLATGASKAFVDGACAKAGGIPVSPPADPDAAPKVAVKVAS